MSTDNAPMTDEELAAIRARIDDFHQSRALDWPSFHMKADARALLAEVERLRRVDDALSEFADRLSLENARLRAQINGTVDEEGEEH